MDPEGSLPRLQEPDPVLWIWYNHCIFYNMFRHANTAIIRCFGLTTYHLHMTVVWKSGTINLLEPPGSAQACTGIAVPRFMRPSSVGRTLVRFGLQCHTERWLDGWMDGQMQWRTEGGRFGGGFNPPPPRNSEGPPKSCQTQPDCENF